MAGEFPCNNPPSQCETNPNPLTSFSSEAEDSTTFIGIKWAAQLPPLNKPFNVYPCEGIAESQVSQADADIKAENLAVACASPCAPIFSNSAQTASGSCPDGSTYSLTIPAGIFTADNQVLADRKAFTAAAAALRGHSICLGSLVPASVCRGEFYFGIITLTTTDAPATIILLSGELPDGLSLTLESDRAVVQGTPTSFGVAHFTLQATSAVGVVTTKTYAVVVTGIVTDSVLPEGNVGSTYSAQLVAVVPEGSTTVWSVTGGSLPDGLTLNQDDGSITGTPTGGGNATFTVSVTAAGNTCSKEFTLHVAGSVSCVCLTSMVDLPNSPNDNNAVGTRTASVRKISVLSINDGALFFVDTSTNTVIASTPTDVNSFPDGEIGCFATSVEMFYWPSPSGIQVFDADGNSVTTIANPADTTMHGALVYSPVEDRIYSLSSDAITGTEHILVIDPNTNTVVNDVDTLSSDFARVCYVPGRLILNYQGSQLVSYSLPVVTVENTLALNSCGGEIAYATNTGKMFVGTMDFVDSAQFVQVDPATLTVENTFTTASAASFLLFIKYNPVTSVILAADNDEDIVVFDPTAGSIVCEFKIPTSNDAGTLTVDYSSGDTYQLQFGDGGHLGVLQPCDNPDICTLGLGALATNRYGIDGYFDGMIPNPSAPSVRPPWNGTFYFYMDGNSPNPGVFGWAAGGGFGAAQISIAGNKACNTQLLFNGCIAGVPQWEILITDIDGGAIWQGEKVGGFTPEGVYDLTGGVDVSPLTLTIVLVDQTSTPIDHGLTCSS